MAKKKGTKGQSGVGIMPVRDLVLIELDQNEEKEEKTASGIIIPPQATSDKSDLKKGVVVAVGEGERVNGELIAPPVSVGDTVLFSWGDKIEKNKNEYYLVNSSNIRAVIEK